MLNNLLKQCQIAIVLSLYLHFLYVSVKVFFLLIFAICKIYLFKHILIGSQDSESNLDREYCTGISSKSIKKSM